MLVVASVKLQVLVQETRQRQRGRWAGVSPRCLGEFKNIRNGLHEFMLCDVTSDGSYIFIYYVS